MNWAKLTYNCTSLFFIVLSSSWHVDNVVQMRIGDYGCEKGRLVRIRIWPMEYCAFRVRINTVFDREPSNRCRESRREPIDYLSADQKNIFVKMFAIVFAVKIQLNSK